MYSPRSPESHEAYKAFKRTHEHTPDRLHRFELAEETVVREFEHWVIIKNRFPYDNMAHTNDLLVAKSPTSDLYSAKAHIQAEFHHIMRQLAEEGTYDAKIENFPNTTSAKAQFHVHLVIWHGTNS